MAASICLLTTFFLYACMICDSGLHSSQEGSSQGCVYLGYYIVFHQEVLLKVHNFCVITGHLWALFKDYLLCSMQFVCADGVCLLFHSCVPQGSVCVPSPPSSPPLPFPLWFTSNQSAVSMETAGTKMVCLRRNRTSLMTVTQLLSTSLTHPQNKLRMLRLENKS